MDSQRQTVLITGASSGIGLYLARLFAAAGDDVVLVARSVDKLQALADEMQRAHDGRQTVIGADLTKPDAPEVLYRELLGKGITVDVLVNNAGFGAQGEFAEVPIERQLEIVQVNVMALTALARLFLPGMLARRSGGILNVASTAAFLAGPYMAVYYATKAYVLSLSEALHEEARPYGVKVSCLCPGPTKTGFAEAAGMGDSKLFKSAITMTAEAVARAGYEGFQLGKTLIIPGVINNIGVFAGRFSPRFVPRKIVGMLTKK